MKFLHYPHHDLIIVDEKELAIGLDDNRNTLVWLPSAETNENGELTIEFFTSDIVSHFTLTGFAVELQKSQIGQFANSFIVYAPDKK